MSTPPPAAGHCRDCRHWCRGRWLVRPEDAAVWRDGDWRLHPDAGKTLAGLHAIPARPRGFRPVVTRA